MRPKLRASRQLRTVPVEETGPPILSWGGTTLAVFITPRRLRRRVYRRSNR